MRRYCFFRQVAACAVLALAGAGCLLPPRATAAQQLTVFAASSLADAFKSIKSSFETSHPGVTIIYNFAGSQQLRSQIEQGAVADVFASANLDEMQALVASQLVDDKGSTVFARNKLLLAVSAQADPPLKSLKELARPKVRLVMADKSVPAGSYAMEFLNAASKEPAYGAHYKEAVLANVVSYETNVRAVLTKVALGEADAGLVYASDALSVAAGKIYTIDLAANLSVIAEYPIAALAKSANKQRAIAFITYILSAEGQQALARHGFLVSAEPR